jgi:stress response protein SCP2
MGISFLKSSNKEKILNTAGVGRGWEKIHYIQKIEANSELDFSTEMMHFRTRLKGLKKNILNR